MRKINKNKKAEGPESGRRIVVAMSGGVDSSVAAALLKKDGFDVIGVFMKFWNPSSSADSSGQETQNRCCSVESEKLARLVAKKIGIPFYVLNVEKEFKKKVVDYFLKEYKKGNTPNPCVVCNKEIKFGFLIKKALSLGADFVATGHYARLRREFPISNFQFPNKSKVQNQKIKLLKGKDKNKDQSYFLWQLDQNQLKHVLFPVGGYTKPEVRKLAKKLKLPTAETPESQEVCFVHPHTKQDHQKNLQTNRSCACYGVGVKSTTNDFLKKYLKTKSGNICLTPDVKQNSTSGVVGRHQGLWFYTIGQRRGLEIPQGSADAEGSGETKPYYVIDKDFKKNILIVSKNQKDLLKKELIVKNVNWISKQKLPINAEVKIRYKSNSAKAKIIHFCFGKIFCGRKKSYQNGSKVKIVFQKKQKAITPGQSAVFYKGEELLGGGVIE